MIFKGKVTRREFISVAFASLISTVFLILKEDKNDIRLSNELRKEIKLYNSKRLNLLEKNIDLAVKDDFVMNKTFWSGNKIYTYAETFNLF